jgi:hypothetical protein
VTFVGIVPDGSTVAKTFNGADPSQAVRWIEGQNRARNIYSAVPRLGGQLSCPAISH